MSERDCQNFEESKQDENSRKPMLISLPLYAQLKVNINSDRMFIDFIQSTQGTS